MSTTELIEPASERDDAPSFEPAVAQVLLTLRERIAASLASIGDFGKPADIFKTLELDRTLARQLFRLASTAEPIGNGGMIPSRASIDRFLAAAKARGAGDALLAGVREAYAAFERLVKTHAGDRATFNSMVSAAGGIDEDWLATDLQHRRNAFRAMSHALGVQTKTRVITFVLNGSREDGVFGTAVVGGVVGMRVLRALPFVRVFATVGDSMRATSNVRCGPIGLSDAGGGYVIERFSTAPLPVLSTEAGAADNGLAREIVIERPVVGNVGATTMMFGTVYNDLPIGPDEPLRIHAAVNQPTERLLVDVLVAPGLSRGASPVTQAVMGFHLRAHPDFGPSVVNLQGHFDAEFLGLGQRALSTLEVPRYVEMMDAVEAKLGWRLQEMEAWRVRVDFPLYQSTLSVEW